MEENLTRYDPRFMQSRPEAPMDEVPMSVRQVDKQ